MVRLASELDFGFIYGLYMHPQINPFLLYERMDADSFKPIFDGLMHQHVKYIYGSNTEDIGMFKLIPLQYRNHLLHIWVGWLCILYRQVGEKGKK